MNCTYCGKTINNIEESWNDQEGNKYCSEKCHKNRLRDAVYIENGYTNRKEYLQSLAEEFDIPVSTVYTVASMLGPTEDFDGLVSSLEDYVEGWL